MLHFSPFHMAFLALVRKWNGYSVGVGGLLCTPQLQKVVHTHAAAAAATAHAWQEWYK